MIVTSLLLMHFLVMLSDPFLQLPTPDSVEVVWFTEFAGDKHWVQWGKDLEHRTGVDTQQLTRTREDEWSYTFQTYDKLSLRPIWRHQAVITGLRAGETLPYQVFSQESQRIHQSDIFPCNLVPLQTSP
ncbi:fibronectin type III domain-containing protein [Synechocystis sp. B12]|nr:fibronectin type III domain-containing protein [Synechocystis sp. B12]